MSNILSPLDGRYSETVETVAEVFSQYRRMNTRVEIEIEYLLALDNVSSLKLPEISERSKSRIRKIGKNFNEKSYQRVKEIDKRINHTIKATEYYLAENLKKIGLKELVPWVHFGLTSEDVNNIAQTLMLRDGVEVLLKTASKTQLTLTKLIQEGGGAVMLGKTHGQPALPTTMGKELLVYGLQIQELLDELKNFEFRGKLTGAVGTLAAHKVAFPKVDWLKFSEKFVQSFGLMPEKVTTQILPTTSWVRLFSILRRLSLLQVSLAQDLWLYISFGYFDQRIKPQEVGSSTMPQKQNPIRLENAEGNGQLAAALFSVFVEKFSHSRLQRDLSDSTVRRNFGVAFGHLLISVGQLGQGLERLKINPDKMLEEVESHPEVLGEAVQTILRREGVGDGYAKAKDFFRGRSFEREKFNKWIETQEISKSGKETLVNLGASNYIGFASEIVKSSLPKLKKRIKNLQ